jgi:S-adenosylmethionine/arginine decarboxylase-like enzyme
MKSKSWGYHFIANIAGCDVKSMQSRPHIKSFLKELLEKTGMNALGAPIFKYIEPTQESINKAIDGFSVVQIITTSSVTMHFVDSKNMIFFDFFSCKKFDRKLVKGLLRKHFGYSEIDEHYLERKLVY